MRRGGKLLLYHGLADENFSAQSKVDHYQKFRQSREFSMRDAVTHHFMPINAPGWRSQLTA